MTAQDHSPFKRKDSARSLTRAASYLALSALTLFALSLFHPKPLTIILSMSVGHILGGIAVVLYLAAVLIDTQRGSRSESEISHSGVSPVQGSGNSARSKG